MVAVVAGGWVQAGLAWAEGGEVPLPDTGQSKSYTTTFGEDSDYIKPRGYTVNGDGTVSDQVTKLVWQQADDGTTRDWATAKSYCQGLVLAGKDDWRLPSIKELITLVHADKYNPAIDTTVFPGTKSSWYWSSTSDAGNSSYAWNVYFFNGYVDGYHTSNNNYVRCVRSGQ